MTHYFFVIDQGSRYAHHKCMYDYEILKTILEEIGFKEMRRCAYRQGKVNRYPVCDKAPLKHTWCKRCFFE